MRLRISYRMGIALAGVAWVLLAYPRSIYFYQQVASGEVSQVVFRLLYHGAVDWRARDVALSVLPIAVFLFLGALYLEAAGRLGAIPRQVLCGLAIILMLATTAAALSIPINPAPLTRVMWLIDAFQLISWVPLMAIFTAGRAPLRSRAAGYAAALVGAANALAAVTYIAAYLTAATFRWRHLLSIFLHLSTWTLIVAFAITTRREAAIRRRESV